MTPQFLRHEAARFRGMAVVAEREPSRLRLLAMATDYEARAQIADEMIARDQPEAVGEVSEPASGEPAPGEPAIGEPVRVKAGTRRIKDPKARGSTDRQSDDAAG